MLTLEQYEKRRGYVCSTDMAAILNVSKWRTAFDVWAEKTGRVEYRDLSDLPHIRAGDMLERSVLDEAERTLGKVNRNIFVPRDDLHMASTCDAIHDLSSKPVEAKTSGLFGPLPEGWGIDGSDVVPTDYQVQCHHHMICLDVDECHLAAFLGGRGFTRYLIPRSEKLVQRMIEEAGKFWDKHVKTDTPPDGSYYSPEIVKDALRESGKIATIPAPLIERWNELRAQRLALEKQEEEAKMAILSSDPDAEYFDFGDDVNIGRWIEMKRAGYTVAASTFRKFDVVSRKTAFKKK